MTPRKTVTIVTPPAGEPLTVDDVKALARIDTTDDDALIATFITAAREAAERWTRRSFMTQTLKLTLDLARSSLYDTLGDGVYDLPVTALYGELPKYIKLTNGPIQSVTSITTYDLNNASSLYASSNYFVDISGGRVVLNQTSGLQAKTPGQLMARKHWQLPD